MNRARGLMLGHAILGAMAACRAVAAAALTATILVVVTMAATNLTAIAVAGSAMETAIEEDKDAPAQPLLLYGPVKFEARQDLGKGERIVVIDHLPFGCTDASWQAKVIADQSSTWLERRRAGSRRFQAQDLVFFQYQGLKFRMPYEKEDPLGAIHFYDPYEMFGFLFAFLRAHACAPAKLPYLPDWPFAKKTIPETPAAITFLEANHGRWIYAESFAGYPTDVYYCKRKLTDAALSQLEQGLLVVKAERRVEDSGPFHDYTVLRESFCGEG